MASRTSELFFEPAAGRLIARGLRADKTELIRRLEMIGEPRLSDYALFHRVGECYQRGTTLQVVWELFEFDSRLRSLCFEAIGYIEAQMRSNLAYRFAHEHGAYGYLDPANFPNFPHQTMFSRWEDRIKEAEASVKRDQRTGATAPTANIPGSQLGLTIWTIAERMDFGTMMSFFQGVTENIQKDIADTVGQPDVVVKSWLIGLRVLRNRCAHHDRIWNWRFDRTRVKIPGRRKFPEWHSPKMLNNQIGILINICRYWLNHIYPDNDWTKRVLDLFDSHPTVPTSAMGLPIGWRGHPLWNA